jgi:hypothetical protein
MKKLLIILLVCAVLVPSAIASDTPVPPPQNGTPEPPVPPRPMPPQFENDASRPLDVIPPIGQGWGADPFAVDLENLPLPEEVAETGFTMELAARKQDMATEWVRSLTSEQRASIGRLLADSHPVTLGETAAELAEAKESGQIAEPDLGKLEASLAEILTPEQYALFQESLLPAPDTWLPDAPESESDCYYAFYYLDYYAIDYAYLFYYYAYLTYASSYDPYAELTFELALDTYVCTYGAWAWSFYAYHYYYDATYAYYAWYFTRHAEGFSYYGYYMAYILYTWEDSSYSYYSFYYGYYAFDYITTADDYALSCYSGSSSSEAQMHRVDLLTDGLSVVGDNRDAPYPEMSIDLTSPPVPEELADTGFAMPLDGEKAQAGAEWVRSMTDEQKARIRAVFEANRSPALERAAAALAQARVAPDELSLDHEALDAAVAEVNRWQRAVSEGLTQILTPEQYELYQESLLPAPDAQLPAAPESQNDCYIADYYSYTAYYYAYYHYYYAYYAYVSYSDPYLYDNYLFGYYDYVMSYYGYVYSNAAYDNYYNATYAYYAWYYWRHAEGFSYYGYPFAHMTYSWTGDYAYSAYVYAYYAYIYIDYIDYYAWLCYSDAPCEGFDSQFNGSADGWVAHSGTWYVDSSYLYTYGLSGTSSSVSYDEDCYTDFDYQVRLQRSGCDTCANRLLVRGTPTPLRSDYWWYTQYAFQYSRDGDYSVYKEIAGSLTTLRGWTYSSAINQGTAWNTLRVVTNGTNLRFYINGTLVWSGYDSSLSSGRVGIGMYRSSTSSGDKLSVNWATLTTSTSALARSAPAIREDGSVGKSTAGNKDTSAEVPSMDHAPQSVPR